MLAFILTRTFAITALLAGAASMTFAAPIPVNKRYLAFCHYGCLFHDADASDSISAVPSPTPTPAADVIEIIKLLSPTPSSVPAIDLINTTPSVAVVAPLSTPTVNTIKIIELEVPTDSSSDESSPLEDLLDGLAKAASPDLASREYDPEAFLSNA